MLAGVRAASPDQLEPTYQLWVECAKRLHADLRGLPAPTPQESARRRAVRAATDALVCDLFESVVPCPVCMGKGVVPREHRGARTGTNPDPGPGSVS